MRVLASEHEPYDCFNKVGFHVAAAMAVAIAMVMIIFDACSAFGDCHGCVSVCLSVYLCAFPFCSGSERRVDRVLCRLQAPYRKVARYRDEA